MKFDLAFDLPFPPGEVWPAFGDVELLVACMPGAALRSAADERPLRFDFAVKLGPIGAKFSGEGDLVYGDHAGTLSGSGTDRATASRVKGQAAFRLEDVPAGTRVHVEVDFALSGVLAQFGRGGIVKEVAAGITARFGANLRARLERGLRAAAAGGGQEEPAPLDAGKLVWDIVRSRFKPSERGEE
jgi:carbon monoxide dehydrogenase subunit G